MLHSRGGLCAIAPNDRRSDPVCGGAQTVPADTVALTIGAVLPLTTTLASATAMTNQPCSMALFRSAQWTSNRPTSKNLVS